MVYQNKVALITGGSSGIGLALAKSLSAMGAHVWVIARRPERLEAALGSILDARKDSQQKCGVVAGDVSDWDQVTSAVERVIQEVGIPDLLFNSAGVAHPGYVQDLDIKIFRWMIDVNYLGTVYATKACLPGMLQRKSGHIVNISSMAGFLGVFGYTAYGASKYAVSGFSDALRAEMKPLGIRVSIVFPSDTDTEQLAYEDQYKPAETRAIAGNLKAMLPEQVAKVILKDVARGRYIIIPGFENRLIHRLTGIVGNAIYPIMDLLIAQNRNGKGRPH